MIQSIKKNMVGIWVAIAAAIVMFVTLQAFGQDPNSVPTTDEWGTFFKSLSGVGGAGIAGIILTVVQLAMLVVRQFVQGKFRLLIVTGLTFIASIVAGFVSGQPIMSALLSAGALSSLQVFIHQFAAQFMGQKK